MRSVLWLGGALCAVKASVARLLGERFALDVVHVDDAIGAFIARLDPARHPAEAYGFGGDLPVHVSEPVPELVPLTTLARDVWVGLPVFHPCAPSGLDAHWLRYDVGVVLEVEEDVDVPGEVPCRFVASMGGPSVSLRYAPENLWVPHVLAERLRPPCR